MIEAIVGQLIGFVLALICFYVYLKIVNRKENKEITYSEYKRKAREEGYNIDNPREIAEHWQKEMKKQQRIERR